MKPLFLSAKNKKKKRVESPATAAATDGDTTRECSSKKRKQEEVSEAEKVENVLGETSVFEDERQKRGEARPRTSVWAWTWWPCECSQLAKKHTL